MNYLVPLKGMEMQEVDKHQSFSQIDINSH